MLKKFINWITLLLVIGLAGVSNGAVPTIFGPYNWGMSPDDVLKTKACLFSQKGSEESAKGFSRQQLYGICFFEPLSSDALAEFHFKDNKLERVVLLVPCNLDSREMLVGVAQKGYKKTSEGFGKLKNLLSGNETMKRINKLKPVSIGPSEIIARLEKAWGKASDYSPEGSYQNNLKTIASATTLTSVATLWSPSKGYIAKSAVLTKTGTGMLTLLVSFFSKEAGQ